MSLISFDKLLSIIETVCEILLSAISKIKPAKDDDSE